MIYNEIIDNNPVAETAMADDKKTGSHQRRDPYIGKVHAENSILLLLNANDQQGLVSSKRNQWKGLDAFHNCV